MGIWRARQVAVAGLLLLGVIAWGGQARAEAVIEKIENKSLTGNAYARLRNLTYAQCEARCLADPQCVALEHYRGGGVIRRSSNCALFSSTRAEAASELSDIGYKRETAGTPSKKKRSARREAGEAERDAGGGSVGRLAKPAEPETARREAPPARKFAIESPAPTVGSPAPVAPAPAPLPRSVTPAPAPATAPTTAPPPRPTARGITPTAPAPTATAPAVTTRDEGGVSVGSSDYHIVPVFYGTDRNRKDGPQRIIYANDRAKRLEVGQALVSVPLNHKVPNIERPRAWNVPFWGTVQLESEDPKRHFTIRQIRSLSKQDLLALVRQRLAGSQTFKGQSIVFIHGYNVSFDDALYRTAQISYDLQFDGAAYTYSWPSGGGLASYVYDRDSAQGAEPYLYEFLQMVQNETGTTNINIIAHSMGNQMLLQVLRSLKLRSPGVSRINQIVLAAPDVDRDAFEVLAREITDIAKGVTLYAAANDRALDASRFVAGNKPRAGDVPSEGPVIVPGIDTIDITGISTSYLALHHSGYAENTELLTDISHLFRTGTRPPELRIAAYRRVTLPAGIYWRYGN